MQAKVFDAIVIGSGITGGWAAKELTEKGLNVLLLERGRQVVHGSDYTTAFKEDWQLPFRDRPSLLEKRNQAKQARTGYATKQSIKHWFVNDLQHPYRETQRFDWIRGYHLGGRSLTWGRQCLRLSDLDFAANKQDGHGIDWPVRYQDIAPWYDKVEAYIGVIGEALNLPQLPDGHFLPPFQLNAVEQHLKRSLLNHYKNRHVTIGRVAHLTQAKPEQGRAPCTKRNRCMRGCPTGSYFSSLASTLPAAMRTGRLTIQAHSIAKEIIYNPETRQATGVKVIDVESKKERIERANIIFCCASTVATTALLLNSTSARFPNGLGNDSGELGHNLMDHHFRVGATGEPKGFADDYNDGDRPVGFHIPRFRNLDDKEQHNFIRGYGYQGYATRKDWRRGFKELSFGKAFREELAKPGPWQVALIGFGECLPYHHNKMSLDPVLKDEWGLPLVNFDCQFGENELRMREDMKAQAVEMLTKAGYQNVQPYDKGSAPGQAIHEMGTARMGQDPKSSVLNRYNQIHSVRNVYVTDGSFMCSSAYQNPSLTYMAFTARAADHAVKHYHNGVFNG
ncbi:GMC family oxidoreductase [Pseudoalteromonas sp. OFAV1]|uniref:FAD-dependent oxidoreductase n=1 Tax=Pseudoalteromonas sp. OFAV1 TaxID=2908892 RepID=UPI001F41DEBA|nr:GMC family oxidoreductase [Pseudoalteromonas sp. OFAV1]MCF2900126.1 GMC family oxidoreductase [Pseudoalteromonas sp. OFAV1]